MSTEKLSVNKDILEEIYANQNRMESMFSEFAFLNEDAVRFVQEQRSGDPRPAFFHDTDRIIHSRAYARYIDKTQVFYLIKNDHITHRVLHVQLVSKIARTIGRFLRLNEDLIEAISLGHDVGHTPFGHMGETILSSFCEAHDSGVFEHNVQSFRLFNELEKRGAGCNLTAQVLDGIICHNGEMLKAEYSCDRSKTKEDLLSEYHASLHDKGVSAKMIPMTLEGCVMRISDVIAYVGRDIEDAIILGYVNRNDIPAQCREIMGSSNSDIVNSLIVDLVNNSYGKPFLKFSPEMFSALNALKEWNYERIYRVANKSSQSTKIHNMFNAVMEYCLNDIENGNDVTHIRSEYLSGLSDEYMNRTDPVRMVADFVSGMTDEYMIAAFDRIVMPHTFRCDKEN